MCMIYAEYCYLWCVTNFPNAKILLFLVIEIFIPTLIQKSLIETKRISVCPHHNTEQTILALAISTGTVSSGIPQQLCPSELSENGTHLVIKRPLCFTIFAWFFHSILFKKIWPVLCEYTYLFLFLEFWLFLMVFKIVPTNHSCMRDSIYILFLKFSWPSLKEVSLRGEIE